MMTESQDKMEAYEIIGWPDIQAFMDLKGFDEKATLITPNDAMGIGSSTYLIDKEWLKSLDNKRLTTSGRVYKHNDIGVNEVGTIMLDKKVYVTDPCYDTTVWCQKLLYNVLPGKYKCFVVVTDTGDWGTRVSELHVVKEEVFEKYKELEEIPYMLEPLDCRIGVDSGQCGIFDADYYETHQPDDDYDNKESWYRRVCELTYNADTVDNLGVVTQSGYGDGSYSLYVAEINHKTVAMKVVFLEDEFNRD